MYVRFRTLVTVSAMVAGVLAGSPTGFAQAGSGGAGCGAGAKAEWMETEVDVTGSKAKNSVTVEADKITVKENIGDIWVAYSFKAGDIKSIDRGTNDDGVVRLTIDVNPVQMTRSSGEKASPPTVAIDMPSEYADAALEGLEALKKGCAK